MEPECVLECLQHLHDPIPLPDNTPVRVGRTPQTQITEARCSRLQVEIQVSWDTREIKVTQLGSNTTSIDGQDLERGKPVCMSPDSTLFILKGMYPHKVIFKGADNSSEADPVTLSLEPEKDMPAIGKKRSAEHTNGMKEDCPVAKKPKSSKLSEEEEESLRNGEEKEKAVKSKPKEDSKQKPSRPDGDTERTGTSEEKDQVGKKRPKEDSKPERNDTKQSKKDLGSGKPAPQKVTDFFSVSSKNEREKDKDVEKREKDHQIKKERESLSDKKGKQLDSYSVKRDNRPDSSLDKKEKHSDRDSKSVHKTDPKIDSKPERKTSSDARRETKRSLQDMSDDEDAHVQTVSEKLQQLKQKAKSEKLESKPSTSSSSVSSKSSEKRKGSVESSAKCKVGKPAAIDSWDSLDEKLYIFTSKGVCASEKIAGFDIDGTIITTQSGRVFPRDTSDWKVLMPEVYGKLKHLVAANYKIVFFTNQLGVGRGKIKIEDLQDKFELVVNKLQVPVQIFISTKGGSYRKPALGMWQILKKQKNDGIAIKMADSFYVGDAAGREADWAPKKKKDFSCSDRLFAINAGLSFHTPEEFFMGHKAASFNLPEFDPRTISTDKPILQGGENLTSGSQEVVVFVGLQASGKTSFAKKHLVPKGYVHINQDTLKTWQKCVSECAKALNAGKSVVIDNTNVDPETRARYIDCAKRAGKPCRCFFFDFTISQCRHNERFREITNKDHQPINEQIFNATKSKFKPPELREGFSKICRVNFLPHFPDKLHEKVYRQFLLEK